MSKPGGKHPSLQNINGPIPKKYAQRIERLERLLEAERARTRIYKKKAMQIFTDSFGLFNQLVLTVDNGTLQAITDYRDEHMGLFDRYLDPSDLEFEYFTDSNNTVDPLEKEEEKHYKNEKKEESEESDYEYNPSSSSSSESEPIRLQILESKKQRRILSTSSSDSEPVLTQSRQPSSQNKRPPPPKERPPPPKKRPSSPKSSMTEKEMKELDEALDFSQR